MNLKDRIHNNQIFDETLYPKFPKKNMLIEITNYCNHRCIFCANQKMTRKKGYIDIKFVERILKEAYNLGIREVGFYTTGEPFMSQMLETYIKMAKNIGMSYVYITTNGALAKSVRIKAAIESGLDSIKFSINGTNRKNYAFIHGQDDFDKVYENLKYCWEYRNKYSKKYNIYISHVITKYTERHLDEFKSKFAALADEIFFIHASNQGGLMPEIKDYLVNEEWIRKKIQCNLPFNAINITYEGYLTACSEDFENALVVADLNCMSLKEAWYSDKMVSLRKAYIEKNLQGTLCHNCINDCNYKFEFLSNEYSTANKKVGECIENNLVKNRIHKYEEL